MEYYCAMVKTGEEEAFKAAAKETLKVQFPDVRFYFFERRLFTKKRGWFLAALFPGYVFFEVQALTPQFFSLLRTVKGFYKILRDNQNPVEIRGDALNELQLFMRNGEQWGVSKLQFLPGQRIRAIAGPLVGYEGNIIMVNKKKKQVTVQSNLTGMSVRFDLKYEDVEITAPPVPEK